MLPPRPVAPGKGSTAVKQPSRATMRLLAAALVITPMLAACAGGGNVKKDTRYVARDVNTLYRPQEDPIVADAVFQQRADSLLAWKKTTPAIVSGGTLGQQAPITVDRLFPGSLWTMDLAEKGIEELLTVQRLKRVDVEVSINGGGFVERVSPTMIPIGTDETQGG